LLPWHVLAGEGNRLDCSKSGDGRLISGTDDDGGSVTHSSDLTTGIDEGLHEIHTPAGVLRYYDTGHDLNGPPLLFLHGSGPGVTGHRNFRGVLPTFSRHFRCLVLEFPGFGVSPDLGGHPMIAAHGAAMSFIDALSLDRFDIIGNSMGGGVGINLAIQHPQRVRRLVTIGGIGTNLFTPGPSEGIRLLQEFTEDPTRQRLIDWLNCMVYDPALITDELIEERWSLASDPQALQAARRMYSKAAFAKMTAMMAKSDAPLPWATMHKVAAPTLLTWGRDDRVSPLDMAIIPMRTIPNAELHVFPNCGHWAMIEAKEAFESTVLAFLERQ
jgi:pimeloyl-ACP methyl ester carboxylesterase